MLIWILAPVALIAAFVLGLNVYRVVKRKLLWANYRMMRNDRWVMEFSHDTEPNAKHYTFYNASGTICFVLINYDRDEGYILKRYRSRAKKFVLSNPKRYRMLQMASFPENLPTNVRFR